LLPRAGLAVAVGLLVGAAACGGEPPPTTTKKKDQRLPDLPRYRIDLAGASDAPADYSTPGAEGRPRDAGADRKSGDGPQPPPAAKCGGGAKLRLQEIATGQPDFLALVNQGPTAIDLKGYRVEMRGISLESYAFKAGQLVPGGAKLYVYEYASGQSGDVQTGENIPFFDALDSNSVALWDAGGYLLDFVAVGDKVVGLPAGASFAGVPWPAKHDPAASSFQRIASAGACPSFKASDWAVKPITRK
jgi:hypothetical protein